MTENKQNHYHGTNELTAFVLSSGMFEIQHITSMDTNDCCGSRMIKMHITKVKPCRGRQRKTHIIYASYKMNLPLPTTTWFPISDVRTLCRPTTIICIHACAALKLLQR